MQLQSPVVFLLQATDYFSVTDIFSWAVFLEQVGSAFSIIFDRSGGKRDYPLLHWILPKGTLWLRAQESIYFRKACGFLWLSALTTSHLGYLEEAGWGQSVKWGSAAHWLWTATSDSASVAGLGFPSEQEEVGLIAQSGQGQSFHLVRAAQATWIFLDTRISHRILGPAWHWGSQCWELTYLEGFAFLKIE